MTDELDLNKLFAEIEAERLADPEKFAKKFAEHFASSARSNSKSAKGVPCGKCRGTGHIPEFRHIAGGNCFDCDGWGYR